MNYKPFDLEAAKRGAEIINRLGVKQKRIVAHVPEAPDYQRVLVLCDDKTVKSFFENGRYSGDGGSDRDLFMAPKKNKLWVNIYDGGEYDRERKYTINESRRQADDRAASELRIACIEVEFEEGQGL